MIIFKTVNLKYLSMNLVGLSLFSTSLVSNTLFKLSPDRNKVLLNESEQSIPSKIIEEKEKKPIDYKTLLGGGKVSLIDQIEEDIDVYFFIEKEKRFSAWNMVVPIIITRDKKTTYQYKRGHFALQGSGTGLSKMDSIILYLKRHENKGYKIDIKVRVVDANMLSSFEYHDSRVEIEDLIESSYDLCYYQKNEFKWVYKQYVELLEKRGLEHPLYYLA